MDGDTSADEEYDFEFKLYNSPTDGEKFGLTVNKEDVFVDQGYFTVKLDFVNDPNVFNGEARWLEIAVRPGAETGAFTMLSPRQELTATPYALYALNGSEGGGFWAASGDDIYNTNAGYVGIGTDTPASMLDVRSTDGAHGVMSEVSGIPVWAHRASTAGTWPAIHGECDSEATYGTAIRGIMTSTSPGSVSAAVRGANRGTGSAGIGVYGSQDGSGIGVFGSTQSGRGVYGSSTSGTGVYGLSTSGTGVWGFGALQGGHFEAFSNSGYAKVGYGNYGIQAYGTYAGGYFHDTASAAWASVGENTYKIRGSGSVSFVQNHPADADNVIVYACPEGDEVATYTRGSARLVKGETVVPLGETFKWVTNPDIGLTAHLTPRGKGSVLYVESLSTREMLVRSMDGFPDDIAFDYIVYGLRIGFEEVSIVQEKDREAYISSMADHRELFERRPELRKYNALKRFLAIGAAVGKTESVDLSAAHALRDAIVEFDPAVHELPGDGRPPSDDRVPPAERDDSRSAVDPDTGDEPVRPSAPDGAPTSAVGRFHKTLVQKDGETEALRARLDALEALVAELSNTEDGGAP